MKIALIGYVWPEPKSSAAGFRTIQLLQAFRSQGWETHLLSAATQGPASNWAPESGVNAHSIQLNHSSFDDEIRSLAPDFILFDRFVTEEQFGARARAACPDAVRIIDTQDLHFLRRGREELLKKNAPIQDILSGNFEASEDAIREISAIYRSDLSLILSDFEIGFLQGRFHVPKELLHLSRFHYLPAKLKRPWSERSHYVFIGNFRHAPNVDALRWIRHDIWPYLREKEPNAELHVYGAYPPKEMMELSNPKVGFCVKGPVEDAQECLSHYRVSFVPLRYGAGIKGKITESWAAGTPVVTTPIGAEGMQGTLPWGGAIASDPKTLVDAAIHLASDSDSWHSAQNSGQTILTQLFNLETETQNLINALVRVRDELPSRRKNNFIGTVLWYQTHRSTEYFSRWIELKNAL